MAENGTLVDRRVEELAEGDWVGLPYGQGFPDPRYRPLLPNVRHAPRYGSQKAVTIPRYLDEDLALLLGMYAAEGHTSRQSWSIVITNQDEGVLQRALVLWWICFGVRARISRQPDRCPSVVVSSKTVVEVFDALGCGDRASEKRIPSILFCSAWPVVRAFLQGLALDAYTSTTQHNAKWAICLDSPELLDGLQQLLRYRGWRSARIAKYNSIYDKSYDEVFLCGEEAQKLLREVSFLEKSKHGSATRLLGMSFDQRRNGADVVPIVHGSVLHGLIPKGTSGRAGKGTRTSHWRSLCDKRTIWPSRHMVERLAAADMPLPSEVRRALEEGLRFSPVAEGVRAC
ncbi:MAG: hypothetical protein JWP14_1561 [Frankiales bacterium]|nr:hypothetical protein [Frankiales bacterium]